MKIFRVVPLQALAILLIVGHTQAALTPENVWCPLWDQGAQEWYENCYAANETLPPGAHLCTTPYSQNNQTFLVGQTTAGRALIINTAIKAAYKRGIKTIDLPFTFMSPDPTFPTDPKKRYLAAMATRSRSWVQQVEAINNDAAFISNGDYIRIRIRVWGISNQVANLLHYSNPTTYPNALTPPMMVKESNGQPDPTLLDISNEVVRNYIRDLTKGVLDDVYLQIPTGKTKVTEVVLALDTDHESTLMATEAGSLRMASFPWARYPSLGNFQSKVNHFLVKEKYLNKTFKVFADQVHAYTNAGVNKNLKAAIFMQTWTMDGMGRGTFDLYQLLKNTGIDKLHHGDMPSLPGQTAKHAAYSASIANRLGIAFDTELTWAHWDRGGSGSMVWNASNLATPASDTTADEFYFQSKAALRYGATGVVYANWSMKEIQTPPNSGPWANIIGNSSTPDSSYLSTGLGFKTLNLLPYSSNKKAIYISTIGRMKCEVSQQQGIVDSGCTMDTYENWFSNFGLDNGTFSCPLFDEKIDMITDGMVLANPAIFNGYAFIYVPFETSVMTDSRVYSILTSLPASVKSTFWYQKTKAGVGANLVNDFNQWISATKKIQIATLSHLYPLLLD